MALNEENNRSSETALAVAMFLAFATSERDMKVPVDDPLISRMLRWSDGRYKFAKLRALHPKLRRVAEESDPGAYGFMVARMLYMDDVVRQEAAKKLDQLVILGAGYDTRAYRMQADLGGAKVFEVDLPATSRDKRSRLKKVLKSVPSEVSYVEVDFNRQELFDRLARHGYDASARTLFVLSGVSMYLPESSVLELFSDVAAHSSPNASILFDYFFDDLVTEPGKYYGGQECVQRLTGIGEEPICGISMGQADAMLASRGLELISQTSLPELTDDYLGRRDGSTVAKPYEFAAVAHAAVKR
jgi:methyltransferase (TIGR00027 family)